MEIKKSQIIGSAIGISVIVMSLFFNQTSLVYFLFGIGVIIIVAPFVISVIRENRAEKEKEEMFLEFARNLVESVKTGTPISKSIVNMKGKSYGDLSKHIDKLANQISLGIPLSSALQTFSADVKNKSITRALVLIGQAEKAGGDIGEILESVAEAIKTSDKLKKERKAAISTLVVQGYIIFLVFIIIVLVMQFNILPMLSNISGAGVPESGIFATGSLTQENLSNAFLYLLLIQSLFSGLAIGKLAEGHIKAGIKHSFALMFLSFIISAGANFFFGG